MQCRACLRDVTVIVTAQVVGLSTPLCRTCFHTKKRHQDKEWRGEMLINTLDGVLDAAKAVGLPEPGAAPEADEPTDLCQATLLPDEYREW